MTNDEWTEQAANADILEVAGRLGFKLKRTGGEAIGHCVAGCTTHGDGFAISIKKQVFLCRPSDAKGNVIKLVRHALGCGFQEAKEFITGDTRADVRTPVPPRNPGVTEFEPEKRKRDDDAIAGVLRRAVPIAGTHAAAYLKARGIDPAKKFTKDLRFVADLDYWGRPDNATSGKELLATLPALVATIRDVDGKVIGLHQTYLDPTEPRKWTPTGATENRPKKIRGSVRGGLIRLGLPGETMAIGEGLETTLKWYANAGRERPDVSIACGVSLGNLASVVLPDDVRHVILLGDGDSDREKTCALIVKAGRHLIETGRAVAVHFAPDGKDFGDDNLEKTPIEPFELFAARVAEEFRPPFVSKFEALFMDGLDDPGPEHEWLIDGWYSAGDRSILGGKSLSGKSFLAIHGAMCVAHNKEFFGAKVRHGLVIYQAGEGRRGIKKRLRAWRKHHDVPFSRNTPFVLLQSPIDLWRADGDTAALIAEIKAIAAMYSVPLAMIVIDTLATATGGADENSFKDMSAVMTNIAKINEATGAHVQLVHHMNAGGEKLRGHTSVYANLDQVILVTRNETTGVRTAVLDKQKDDVSDLRFQFELMSVALGEAPDGAPISSCVCLPIGEKEAHRRVEESKGAVLENDEIIFMKALFEADKHHGEPVPAEWDLPPEVRSVVSYAAVKRCYVGLSPSDIPPAESPESDAEVDAARKTHIETLRKRLQRLREKLTRLNILGVHDGRVFWTGKALRAFPQTVAPDEDAPAEDGYGSDIPF